MDYDNNDFQGQNLQLAGEGGSKLSPVLRPYALPKFDFDDGLQGHLRFDSLVENEVFLGISSQEDNQWIEDFSRGSSGIEFSSSAAESCSISRRNNVWSEATSSESVEMLLKSVGQEEIVCGETIVEESDACHELDNLTEQMEPHMKQDDKVTDFMDSYPALPTDELVEHVSRLNDVEGTSQTQGAERSTHGSSHVLDPNASSETCGVFMTQNNVGVDRRSDGENQIEVDTSVHESLDNRMQKDSTGSGMQIDDVDSSSQDIAVGVEMVNQKPENQVSDASFENANCLLTNTGKAAGEHHILSKEVDMDAQILKGTVFETGTRNLENLPSSSSKVESIEQHSVETGINNFEEPTSLPLKGVCNLQIAEGCSEVISSTDPDKGNKFEHVDLSNSCGIHQRFRVDMHQDLPAGFQGDGNLEGCAIEVSNMNAGIPSSSELKMDQIKHGENSSGADNKVFDGHGDGSSSNYVGDHFSLTVPCSSTEFHGERHTIENLKGVDDASGVHKEDLNAEGHGSLPLVAGSMKTYEQNLVPNSNDMHYDQDVSFNEKEKAKLPNDSSDIECEIIESLSSDKKVKPSSQGEGMKVNNVVVHGSECTTAMNEPALDVTLENTNLASHDTLNGVPLLSGAGATGDQVIEHLDKNKRTEDEGLAEAHLLSLRESPERASNLHVLELEKGTAHNSAIELSEEAVDQSLPVETLKSASRSEQSGEFLHNTVAQPSPMAENSSMASQIEQAVKANEISENSSNKLEVCLALCDSTVKQDGGAKGLIIPGSHEEAAVGKNHEMPSSKVADSDKPKCGTPTVITCTMLSQSEKEKKEGVQESKSKSVPLSEVTVQSTPQNVSGNDAAKNERSFTFEVHPSQGLSGRETGKDGQSLSTIKDCKISTIVVGSPLKPGVGQMDPKMLPGVSHGSSQTPDREIARGRSKGTSERKTRRASGKATVKETAKKGNHVKETTPLRQSERQDKSCNVSVSFSGAGQLVPFEGLKAYGNVERNVTVPCGVISVPTSILPDLNSSALPSALFQQPFTDLQQVQLRAQIFVYGSLIQGATPDEACMTSAFGASDGGRSVWEPVWRACVERLKSQKSHPSKSENPVQPRSGVRPLDQSSKQGALQSKVLPSPVVQASSKGTPSPVVNSMIPLSSPLWNISTPSSDGLQSSVMPRSGLLDYHQTLSPLHSFQTPHTRSFVGHNTSWLPQSPFPGPWVTSSQASAFDTSARFSVLPMTETVKLTPVKESVAPFSSGTKHASPSTVVNSTGPVNFVGSPSLPDMKKATVLSEKNSTEPKGRKRKKATVSENLAQIPLLAQTRIESVSAPIATGHLSTSVVVSTPACFASKGNDSKIITAVSPTSLTAHQKGGEQNAEQKAALSEDTFSKVEEAKRQAEDAASFAAAAVSHSQSVWTQLDKQKSSGLTPDAEAKLASAAVAVAAAASVAKAAAAAAKIASNAALQAKLMADEALISSSNPTQCNAASLTGFVNNMGKATPASISKGGDGSSSSSSVIVAAREAARRRVEAASAASKHAENLDAIVKAAELAAEAVSQAGKIVAMGDPFPLNGLVKAGPDGYWRVPQMPPEQGVTLINGNGEQSEADNIEEGFNVSGRHGKEGPSKEARTTNRDLFPLSREFSGESLEDHTRAVDGISSSFTSSEKDSRGQRNRRASDLAKTIGVVPESEIGSRSASITAQDDYEKGAGTLKENSIKEGCLVEVHKEGDEFKAAWYLANVSSLKDGKAFVVYLDLQSDDGSKQLTEWVALEGEGHRAPQIRIDRRTAMCFEGTRKRRRAAVGEYVWSVGDRVDAWIKNCWREGVVTEKNSKDDTTLTVHFPAGGETSVVRAWHLRPTLIWKDGEWIEFSSSRQRDPSSQGDTPQEKRLKLGRPSIEGKEKDDISKNVELVESEKPGDSQLLPLSANEKVFNVGKNTRHESKPDTLRTVQTGLQKEGSRVVFGVPKPGKKRKFMEVSKHYVAEKSSKTNEPNDSAKFAKYLMPQGSGSRGWKNTKIDAKEKQPAESKARVLKSGRPLSVFGRTLPQKNKFLTSAPQNEGTVMDHAIKDSVNTDKNESGQQNLMEYGSFSNTEGAAQGPILFSSLALPSDAPSKKISTSNAKSERVNKGKFVPSTGKLAKVEVKNKPNNGNPGKLVPEVMEPRRSNRRIQPTSRLLEGLQSSLMISKIPSVSQDKTQRSQNKGSTSRRE
ncbi:uncharacterized protein LOC114266865 isoform X2 [Camellia sinensis]|uniref:uncharacterized protein LOC114266865 isoform X2 n=1 Tax=Camellia sinensis TaxID=4442 RepID=UPI001035F8CA|nr:uncharacterized protein LOC114266865 isoform X2 [Camellia sinensis]